MQLLYEDPDKWASLFHTYVLLTMIRNRTMKTTKTIKFMERFLLSANYCFVENLKRRGKTPLCEYKVLASWFDFLLLSPQVNLKLDLVVYMRTSPEVALQ